MNVLSKVLSKISYNPTKFWDDWAGEFIQDSWQKKIHHQHNWLLRIVRREHPRSILEVGCGFGRNINFLIENGISPEAITGFDISSNMIKLSRKYLKSKKVKLLVASLADFKTKKKFDFVFTHGVLMHVPKSQIEDAVSKLLDLTRKDLILIEQNYEADNNYTFAHNYKELLSSKEIDIIEYRSDRKLGLDLIYAKVR